MNKKVLILISHFLPGNKIGGPLASNINIINSLSENFKFSILTSCHDIGDIVPYQNVETKKWHHKDNYSIYYLPQKLSKLFYIYKEIKNSKCEIIYINSFFDFVFSVYVILLSKLGLFKYKKIIIAPRGEFVEGCMNFKSKRKNIYIKISIFFNLYKNCIWHASTENEKNEIISWLKVDPALVKVALNIPNVGDNFKIEDISIESSNNILNIVFLSRISKEKNLPYALEILRKVKRDINFDIYGPKEDLEIWNKCENLIILLPKNIKVAYKGTISRDLVRNIFFKYDLFLFPSVGENFGHVIVESLLSGTQVVISDKTPWRNLQKDALGWDLALNDSTKFISVIEGFDISKDLFQNFEKRLKVRSGILERLQIDKIVLNYNNLFN